MLYSTLTENKPQEHIIFYVDDDPDDRQLLTRALNTIDNNYRIIEAEDGDEAMKMLKRLKETGKLPSLIVLDINMPKVDGKQTYISIKSDEELSVIPVIIFSTSKSEMDKLFFKRKNTEYITKPSDYSRIEEVAARILAYCSSLL
jgi:CheY-like chemotaxis protein